MAEKVNNIPQTVEELVHLQNYLIQVCQLLYNTIINIMCYLHIFKMVRFKGQFIMHNFTFNFKIYV